MRPLVLCALFLALASHAEQAKYLTLKPVKGVSAKAGAKVEIVVQALVDKGYHIQANPASKPNLIATTLTLPGNTDIMTSAPVYPEGKPWKLLGTNEEISTYDGLVTIKMPAEIATTAKAGKQTLEGRLRYQACNERTCYFPMNIPFKVSVSILNP